MALREDSPELGGATEAWHDYVERSYSRTIQSRVAELEEKVAEFGTSAPSPASGDDGVRRDVGALHEEIRALTELIGELRSAPNSQAAPVEFDVANLESVVERSIARAVESAAGGWSDPQNAPAPVEFDVANLESVVERAVARAVEGLSAGWQAAEITGAPVDLSQLESIVQRTVTQAVDSHMENVRQTLAELAPTASFEPTPEQWERLQEKIVAEFTRSASAPADPVAEQIAFELALELEAFEKRMLAFVAERDKKFEEERDRLIGAVLEELLDALPEKSKAKIAKQMVGMRAPVAPPAPPADAIFPGLS